MYDFWLWLLAAQEWQLCRTHAAVIPPSILEFTIPTAIELLTFLSPTVLFFVFSIF